MAFKFVQDKFSNFNLKDNNNNRSKYGKSKAKKQKYSNAKIEQTAQTQRFIESVDNAVKCVSGAAIMYKRESRDDDMVDILSDNAIMALNMFAVCCEELYKDKNKNAIDLGTKRAMDKFAQLESKNIEVYELIKPHRGFIMAALAGQKDLRYEEDRVDSAAMELFENNVQDINAGFAAVIQSNQKFNKRQQSYQDPETNQELAKQQQSQLNEYRNSSKYKNKHKNKSKNKSKYVRPKQSDLYFTKSGKESQFRDESVAERKEEEQRAMEVELNGAETSAYDKLIAKVNYNNAVLMLSDSNSFEYNGKNIINKPIACQMLQAARKHPENEIVIRLCYPYNDCTIDAPVDMLQVDEKEVIKCEDKYIKRHGKLGHISIRQQQVDFDNDQDMSDSNI